MILPESHEFAYVIGIVGEAGSGKSTLARELVAYLSNEGVHVVARNAGDAFRDEADSRGISVSDYIALHEGNRKELDRVVDTDTLDRLRMAIGMAEWQKRYGERPPVVLVLAGRMLSWLAEIPLHSGELTEDALFRIAVECDDTVKGLRGQAEALSQGEAITADEALRRYKQRDADDEASFGGMYGIESMDALWDQEIHDMVICSSESTPLQEVLQVVCELRSRGLLWGECVGDPSGDLLHI